MGFLRDLFGPNPDVALWKEIAREIGGKYDSGTHCLMYRTSIGLASYSTLLKGRSGKHRIYYNVMQTRFHGQQDINFNISKNYVWDEGLKNILFKDLAVGDDELDKKFNIKGDNLHMLQRLLIMPAIKTALLTDLESFEVGIQSDGSYQQLYYRSYLSLNKQQLKLVITLFDSIANRLLEMGLVSAQLPDVAQGGIASIKSVAPPKTIPDTIRKGFIVIMSISVLIMLMRIFGIFRL